MAYGYKEWVATEGVDDGGKPKDPAQGAYQKVVDVVDSLTYPRSGWGMIQVDQLVTRLQRMVDGHNAAWDNALRKVIEMVQHENFVVYCKNKIDPKNIIKLAKAQVGGKTTAGTEESSDAAEA